MGDFNKDVTASYQLKDANNGVYVFVISGKATIDGKTLNTRDALGIWDAQQFIVDIEEDAKVMLMEVPITV
jgi:redox-sensitive bicupin YhaK (pirin superfamily)